MELHSHAGSRARLHDDLRFDERNAREWSSLQRRLFPATVPNQATWDDIDRIVDVLNVVGEVASLNHMHLPWGGGMDLSGAESSLSEPGCVELLTPGAIYLAKVDKLNFESCGDDPEWSYFWIEAGRLEPSGVYPDLPRDRAREDVIDVGGGCYTDWSCWDSDLYRGGPLPEGSRRVIRCLRGSFLIVQKTSLYNRNPQTYDGRHNKMGRNGFRSDYARLAAAALKIRH